MGWGQATGGCEGGLRGEGICVENMALTAASYEWSVKIVYYEEGGQGGGGGGGGHLYLFSAPIEDADTWTQ